MKTFIWGPSAWRFLHAMSFAYPEDPSAEHKQAVLNLFASLKYLLPCGDCCAHYCSSFDSDSLKKSLGSRDNLSKWLVEFHNSVNTRLGKPMYAYDEARQFFLSEEASCEFQPPQQLDEFPWKKYLSAILISLLVVGLLWLLKRKK